MSDNENIYDFSLSAIIERRLAEITLAVCLFLAEAREAGGELQGVK